VIALLLFCVNSFFTLQLYLTRNSQSLQASAARASSAARVGVEGAVSAPAPSPQLTAFQKAAFRAEPRRQNAKKLAASHLKPAVQISKRSHPLRANLDAIREPEGAYFDADQRILRMEADGLNRTAQSKLLYSEYAQWHTHQLREGAASNPGHRDLHCVVLIPVAGLGDSASVMASVFSKAVAAGHLFFVKWQIPVHASVMLDPLTGQSAKNAQQQQQQPLTNKQLLSWRVVIEEPGFAWGWEEAKASGRLPEGCKANTVTSTSAGVRVGTQGLNARRVAHARSFGRNVAVYAGDNRVLVRVERPLQYDFYPFASAALHYFEYQSRTPRAPQAQAKVGREGSKCVDCGPDDPDLYIH
jgi:hypothetical protein